MANDRLRNAILTSGLGFDGLAEGVGVDRKTVERWVGGRSPYRKYRHTVAAQLGLDVSYLFPDSQSPEESADAARAELVGLYPNRYAAPEGLWRDVFGRAGGTIDMLVYAAFWLSEDRRLLELLQTKASAGVRVRIALGDPESPAVRQRGDEEGIGDAIASKIRNVIRNYDGLRDVPNIEIRLHDTVLYNSIHRADDEMLVNPHIYGIPASSAPLMHLRRLPEAQLFSTYLDSFEAVWARARPLDPAKAAAA